MTTISFLVPSKQPDKSTEMISVPFVARQSLQYYLKTAKLVAVRKAHRCLLKGTRVRLRMLYVPKPGDVIVLEPAGVSPR